MPRGESQHAANVDAEHKDAKGNNDILANTKIKLFLKHFQHLSCIRRFFFNKEQMVSRGLVKTTTKTGRIQNLSFLAAALTG